MNSDMKVGDVVKVRGTRETYELGIQHQTGRVVATKCDGEIVHVALAYGRLVKLSAEEVQLETAIDKARRESRAL